MSSSLSKKVLVVDDEADVLDVVCMNLKTAGFSVATAENGTFALAKARSEVPDLIILDLMLPGMSGLDLCRLFKKEEATAAIPIIMLTAKAEEVDRVVGLELGADDYVAKPFSPRELVLRVQSVLRRGTTGGGGAAAKSGPEERYALGPLVLDRARHEVTIEGERVDLTATEFKLLAVLLERRGRVQGRERLLNDVWGYESVIDTRTVDTHVRRLREKMGQAAEWLETVRGVGYRIVDRL
ncbi:MAG: response regulator transcription factor [Verrucomicrobium sp.]|nr:response regulator transcription factor [Verrucomicrobium sp.]